MIAKVLMVSILFFFLGVLMINVVTRYGFGYSISWNEELTSLAIIWMVFLGGGIISRGNQHLSIEALAERLPVKAQWVLNILIAVLTIAVSVILCKLSMNQVALLHQYGQVTAAAKLPIYIAYLVLPIGFTLIILGYLEYLLKLIYERDQTVHHNNIDPAA
jgi:TRAP-type C4-dicarboxylate transport system permease small subunit